MAKELRIREALAHVVSDPDRKMYGVSKAIKNLGRIPRKLKKTIISRLPFELDRIGRAECDEPVRRFE